MEVKIITPLTPNFITVDDGDETKPFPIRCFTEEELEIVGKKRTIDLIKKSKEKKH